MWREGYKEKYDCHVCEIPITEENYDWVKGMCKKCSHSHTVKVVTEALAKFEEYKEKAEKFDELQKLWWWLDRRTHDGVTPTSVIRYFLQDAKQYFEPYKEEDR